MEKKEQERLQEEYQAYVLAVTPTASLPLRMGKAFLTGGAICLLGQIFFNAALSLGAGKEDAAAWCSLLLILCSAILTGLGIYPVLASFGGAGALVPITGFANSIAACAKGHSVEGQVFGVGARIFQIAGPVILYGLVSSWCLGLIYFIGTVLP